MRRQVRKLAAPSPNSSRFGDGVDVSSYPNEKIRVAESIDRVIAEEESARIDLPHVVCVFDRDTGLPSAFGPFESPVAASVFADQYLRDVGCDQCSEVRAVVIPLDSGQREPSRQEHFRSARH